MAMWVVPLLILVANMYYASFFQQKYWIEVAFALHLFGSSVDAVWALLTKLDIRPSSWAREKLISTWRA